MSMKKAAGGSLLRRRTVFLFLLVGAALLAAPVALAQDAEQAAEAEHTEHSEGPRYRHAVTLFAGAATHTEQNDTGGAIGLSYAYVLSHKWAVGVKFEYASSQLERDFVILPGVAFEPVERVELAVGFGVERARKEESEHGETHTVEENEALLRLTFAYAFHIGSRMALSPEFNADITSSNVTYVYGLAFSVGL
jgi:hypothetical protein